MSVSFGIPTCFLEFLALIVTVVGSLDPYLAGSIALYNICEMDNAYLFGMSKKKLHFSRNFPELSGSLES